MDFCTQRSREAPSTRASSGKRGRQFVLCSWGERETESSDALVLRATAFLSIA